MKRKSKYDREIKTTVGAAVEDALNEFESLGSEMREWYDNMPESLQGSSKAAARATRLRTCWRGSTPASTYRRWWRVFRWNIPNDRTAALAPATNTATPPAPSARSFSASRRRLTRELVEKVEAAKKEVA